MKIYIILSYFENLSNYSQIEISHQKTFSFDHLCDIWPCVEKFDTIQLLDVNTTRINSYEFLNFTRLLNDLGTGRHDFFRFGLGLKFLTHLPE